MTKAKNKFISVILAVMVAVAWCVPAFADDVESTGDSDTSNEAAVEETKPAEKEQSAEQSEDSTSTSDSSSDAAADSAEQAGDNSKSTDKKNAAAVKAKGETDGHSHYDEVNNSTSLADGTYEVKDGGFSFSGGSNHVSYSCDKVIIKEGKAKAVIRVNSPNYSYFFTGTVDAEHRTSSENTDLTDEAAGVYKTKSDANSSFATIPVSIGSEMNLSGLTTVENPPYWINYKIKVTVTEEDRTGDATDDPGEGTEPENPGTDDPTTPTNPVTPTQPTNTQKLSAGTWKVKATTDRQMFNLYPKEQNPAWMILKVQANGSMTATIILNGDGYDYVYMGTPAQARSAGKNKWIKATIVKGYYTFDIPVSALDKKLAITPHSWKYEHDANPSTDPWRPNKWIMFYSSGAQKVSGGTSLVPSKARKLTEKKITKWKDAKNKGTSKVDNSTSLKDGTYKPSKVRWSGGSGRLAYIHCTKVTVKNGKAYATLEFASSKYDSLRANGTTYSKQGGGNSKFVIPIKLNANNTIIGRTTAMSQPHWIEYKIFVYIPGATSGKDGKDGEGGGLISTDKLPDKAPELIGLENVGETKVEHAKLFKIFKYEQGITLIAIDQSSGTALYKKPKKDSGEDAKADNVNGEETVEYDEDGKPIAKSENVFTNELYQNNVVNYLVVPGGVELPAGMEKDCIIIHTPVVSTFAFAEEANDAVSQLGMEEALQKMDEIGEYDKPDFKKIVLEGGDLVVLPSEALPEKVTKKSTDEEAEAAKEKEKTLRRLQMRYSSLSVPVIVDRSRNEETKYGDAEWVKVYGAIYGSEEAAAQAFDKYVKDNKKDNKEEKVEDEQ